MFTLIKFLLNRYKRRASASDLGKRVSVYWEKGQYRDGFIDWISADGGFSINFDGKATMVVPAMIRGYRSNPFFGIIEL